ncbi:MAG: phosphatase PAP2 family protein [Candidatus Nanopelagicales bacterium]
MLGVSALLLLLVSSALSWRGNLEGAEVDTFRAVNDLPGWLRDAMWLFMQLGWIGAVAVVAVVGGLITRKWLVSVAVIVAGVVTWLLAKEVKDAVERARPPAYLNDVHLREGSGLGLGFPSGHAAIAGAMVTVLWPHCGKTMRVVIVTLALLVSLARVYFGVHFPLDVIGGAALGVVVGLIVNWTLALLPRPQSGGAPRADQSALPQPKSEPRP